jgi:hypothetical protein
LGIARPPGYDMHSWIVGLVRPYEMFKMPVKARGRAKKKVPQGSTTLGPERVFS